MIMLSQRREVGEFKKRYKWMALVVLLSFAGLSARVVQLQLVQHDEWAAVARENITKTISLPATRGLVRDTRGRVVATNRPSYHVYVTPQLIDPDRDIARVAELMGMTPQERADFRRRLDAVPLRRRTHQILMFQDISRDQLAALETHETELPGVDVLSVPVRTYPFETLGAHAIGYLNEVSAEDLERLDGQGYRAGDRIGRMGVEKAWESFLRGRRGFRRILVDARGRRQEDRRLRGDPQVREEFREPSPGRDLVLTLDMDLMRTIQRTFRGHPSGAVVVVDVKSGRIRALYAKPSYDLNEMSGRLSQETYREMTEDPFRPLIDKTIYESYFPGSTFKPISAIAALDSEVLDTSFRVECPGYYQVGSQKMKCTSSHGEIDMHGALVQSCNVYFWKLAEQVGLERLNRYAREFGLGERTGVGINSESKGFLASREWYEEHYGRFRVGYTLNTAIGQGNTRTTLLQLALAYAALANGGTLYAPQLVESIQSPDGDVIEEFPPRVRRTIDVGAQHLAVTVQALRGVVNEQSGTAFDARIEDGITVAGKTGTAEVARGARRVRDPRRAWYFNRSHAWFAGFAPAEDPEVALVVLVEHGGAGGKTAAPLAIQILQDYLGARQATTAMNQAGQ